MATAQQIVPPRAPTTPPNFTVKTLRAAIPAHCFERSLQVSVAYLLLDLFAAAALLYASIWIEHPSVPSWLAWSVLYPLYWYWQGAVLTGVWVIAHECGHGAFSKYPAVNDSVGLTLHSCLLVPYFSWKHSHRRHHSNTGSSKDEVFVPPREHDPLHEYGLYRAAYLSLQLLLGWPLYLLFNASGRDYSRRTNHFDPFSPIFSKRERIEVVISDLALVLVGLILVKLGAVFGSVWLIKKYFIPYLVVNFWLVMITYLQHTHPSLPHYEDDEWDWIRGALATVDRNFGILNVFHHHIADTHVCHHLFSQLPHYHAQEATEAIKGVLGDYYRCDPRNVFVALWEDRRECNFVAPDDGSNNRGVLWFRRSDDKLA